MYKLGPCGDEQPVWTVVQGLTDFFAFIHEAEVEIRFRDFAPAVLTSA